MTTVMKWLLVPALAAVGLMPAPVLAHSALCSCYDNGDKKITCEGGFSDGSSAAGVRVFVRNDRDETVARGEMNANSEFTFDKPDGAYRVIFDAGPGHQIEIESSAILE